MKNEHCADNGSRVLRRITASLTAKIVLLIGMLITAGGGAFWYISLQNDQKNLIDNTLTFVTSFSEVLKKSVRNDMLLARREDIQRTIEAIGATKSIADVKIYDTQGIICYSAVRSDLGRHAGRGSRACIGCHGDPSFLAAMLSGDRPWDIHAAYDGSRVLRHIEPIYNDPDCSSAACHAHKKEQKVLGILATDFSLLPMDLKIHQQNIDSSVYFLLYLTASGITLYYVLWRFVLNPVKSLTDSMENVARGDLSERLAVTSQDEIGRLAVTFNAMTGELGDARKKMEQWAQSLEAEVKKKTEEILKTQGKLIEAEKLAALGRLTAEIAHEIRNPLTAVGGFGRRLQKISSSPKEREYVDIMVREVHRLELILRDVLTFSRDAKIRFKRTPVTDMTKECIMTFSAICDEHSIKVHTLFGTDRPAMIDREQVRHAVNNLIANAIDVMPGGGVLSVTTTAEKLHETPYVAIRVSDTGPGIPEDKLPYVFEPFYTTKEIGRGTGLGLSISRKIMEEHGGHIIAKNRNGNGLSVSLYFPYQSEEDLRREKCWEYMECGRDRGPEAKCPAHPYFGRVCWAVGGTYCGGKVQGTFAQKCDDCKGCSFYQKVLSQDM
ncbi:MAG: HAMP domain-containing histidine kinase [Nitrospirae bacterium]|nr:HAMP domain-containing histidine kinase [Nitrospirota bacterium]